MAQENITVQLPVTGQTAVIRGFIPHKVSRKLKTVFLGRTEVKPATMMGVEKVDEKQMTEKVSQEVTISGKDLVEFNDILVAGMTIQIGEKFAAEGDLSEVIDELPEEDFEALVNAVDEVYKKKSATDPKS